MTDLIDELYKKSKPFFQEYIILSAHCPRCGALLAIKYASSPKHLRRLSVIIACTKSCDRAIWSTDAKEGFTHWWLDGTRDRTGYKRIVDSLPTDERRAIQELERGLRRINRLYS